MKPSLEYQEFPVPAELQRYFKCAWWLSGTPEPGQIDTIYPDGCCEIILHRGTPPRIQLAENQWQQQGHLLFAAQHRTAIRLAAGRDLDCIGIRLQPAASAALCNLPLASIRDQVLELRRVNVPLTARLQAWLEADATLPVTPTLWNLLSEVFEPGTLHAGIEAAATEILLKDGVCRIDALAKAAGLSMRQFQTRFSEVVGLTAKEFCRVIRLQASLRQLDQGAESLSDLAVDSGFSDQAHANREVRRMTGLTPARLRAALQSSRGSDEAIRMAAAFVRGYAH